MMMFNLGLLSARRITFLSITRNQSKLLTIRNHSCAVLIDNHRKLLECTLYKRNVANYTDTLIYSNGTRKVSSDQKIEVNDNFKTTSKSNIAILMFDNYQLAYGRKSTFELLRALCFFFLCRFSFCTDNAVKIMEACYKIIGRRCAEFLIKKAAYEQFVAGQTADDVREVAYQLRQGGVSSILCVPMETDLATSAGKTSTESFLDANLKKVLDSMHLSTQLGDCLPMVQFRISALLASDLTKTVSGFCAETMHNLDVLNGLTEAMLGRDVDVSKLPGWGHFPRERAGEFQVGLQRLGHVIQTLKNRDVIALIDAEYTYINPALRLLSLCLMKACNAEYAKIFYTYQAYLKATLSNLKQDLTFAAANNFGFGVKLVRGAYIVAERQLARQRGCEDPVNETFEITSASYHSCLDLLLEQMATRQPGSVRFMIASHNEDTVKYAANRMGELGVPANGSHVFFGQLYGMADHVSFTLGSHGYRVYKSIPYGPIRETLPYLARRAQENKSILANARREQQLVAKALLNRMQFKL